MALDDEGALFRVVMNPRGEHAIWPRERGVPPGWQDTGFEGDKAACLAEVAQRWRDMRPVPLRQALRSLAR
ncbi:MbtH family protein (plasmid) [Microvirga sp. VF16]|nr:MbtH family protein [Microvirga sp. VF16]